MNRHNGVTCDGCGISNFFGVRHKCFVCFDYDLCNNCFEGGVTTNDHSETHPMQRISLSKEDGEYSDSDAYGYSCPYCPDTEFNEEELYHHVSAEHADETRRAICPICAARPDGDPNYVSRDFVGHMNLRHGRRLARRQLRVRNPASSDPLSMLVAQLDQRRSNRNPPLLLRSGSEVKDVSSPKNGKAKVESSLSIKPRKMVLSDAEKMHQEKLKRNRAIFVQDLLVSSLLGNPDPDQ